MNPSVAKLLLALFILFVGMISAADAQGGNPLRHNAVANPQIQPVATNSNPTQRIEPQQTRQRQTQPQSAQRHHPNDMSPEVFDAIYTPKRDTDPPVQQSRRLPTVKMNQQNNHRESSVNQAVVDRKVLPAGYSASPGVNQNNMRPVADMLAQFQRQSTQRQSTQHQSTQHQSTQHQSTQHQSTQLQPNQNQTQNQNQPLGQHNRLGSSGFNEPVPAVSKSQPKQQEQVRFQQLIQNIAWSTCIVLVVGVGFIFAAKQWIQRKTPTRKQAETPIKIASTLRLSPKSSLFLVEAGEQRLIVASDQNGIKSVVALDGARSEEESFAATLTSLSEAANSTADRDSVLLNQNNVSDLKTVEDSQPSSPDVYSLGSVGKSNTACRCKQRQRLNRANKTANGGSSQRAWAKGLVSRVISIKRIAVVTLNNLAK